VTLDVDTRPLRAFVAVADELNFTRAARWLFVAQQALSSRSDSSNRVWAPSCSSARRAGLR
jgi:hypothetical protein